MRSIFFFILIAISTFSFGRQEQDSLIQVLNTKELHDTLRINTMMDLSLQYIKSSSIDSTELYFNRAIALSKKSGNKEKLTSCYMKVENYHREYADYEKSILYLDSAFLSATSIPDYRQAFKALKRKGVTYRLWGDYKNANKYYTTALDYAEAHRLDYEIADALNSLGVFEFYKGNHLKSLQHYSHAKEWFEKVNSKVKLISLHNNIGIVYMNQGDVENAEESFRKSIDISMEDPNSENTTTYMSLINLSLLYRGAGRFDEAFSVLEESFRLSVKNKNNTYRYLSTIYLSEAYEEAKNYNDAWEASKDALLIAEKIESECYITRSLLQQGAIDNTKREHGRALKTLLRAQKLITDKSDVENQIRLAKQLCIAYRGLDRLGLSEKYGLQAYDIARKEGMKKPLAKITKEVYKTYKQIGKHGDALYFLELNKSINDSLLNESKALEIGRLQERINTQEEKRALLDQQKKKELEIEQQKFTRDMLLVLIIIIAIFAFSYYRNYKRKAESNKMLQEMNNEIHEQKEEIITQKEDLYSKNMALERLNEEKNGLISVVAHDLRSPMNTNIGLANLIKIQGPLSEAQEGSLKLLNKVCLNGLRLIEEILYLHTLEASNSEPSTETTTINCLLREKQQNFMKLAEKKDILLMMDIPETSIIANINPSYLSRIIDNLMTNAIKYTPKGKEVFLRLSESDEHFRIKIKDEGQGFSKEDQKKMFRKFQRLSAQPTAGESSTGLGLSIVKGLIEKMNGKMTFSSEKNVGTEFILTFQKREVMSVQVA